MKQRVKKLSVSLLTAIAVTAAVAEAQGQQGGNMHKQMPAFEDFDLNGDGVLDEAEFYQARGERIAERAAEGRQMKNLAEAPDFTDIDTDGNGEVNAAEFSAHQAEHRRQKSGDQEET